MDQVNPKAPARVQGKPVNGMLLVGKIPGAFPAPDPRLNLPRRDAHISKCSPSQAPADCWEESVSPIIPACPVPSSRRATNGSGAWMGPAVCSRPASEARWPPPSTTEPEEPSRTLSCGRIASPLNWEQRYRLLKIKTQSRVKLKTSSLPVPLACQNLVGVEWTEVLDPAII